MSSVNDATDPKTGEITDYSCAVYYKLLEVLTKLDDLETAINTMALQIGSSQTLASVLINEYYGNQDMDNNNLIYGYDFYISTDCPESLRSIPKHGIPMSWADYLASL